MKKLGFTLAEIMVALTIVGIIAAVAGPAVTNIAPDKNKVIYLDYYNKLGDTIQKALADQELYNRQMTTDSSNSELFEAGNCIELGCTNATTKSGYPNYQGTSKLTRIIARDWGLKDPGSSTTLNLEDNNKLIFTPNAGNNGGASTLSYSVELQIPNGGKACIYSATCLKPRYFKYGIDTYGNITGGDALSRAFIQNPNKMNDKKKDYDCAAKLLAGQACTD